MPGHGRTTTDTHHELPTVTANEDELETDLAPFQALNQARIGMTGHLLFKAWDAEMPATLSPTIINDIIRKRIGFDGLLLTDDIDMEALDGTVPERAIAAHAAGCDIVLNCWAKMPDMVEIADQLPAMDEMALARLNKALEGTRVRDDIGEHAEMLAKRDRLLELAGEAA